MPRRPALDLFWHTVRRARSAFAADRTPGGPRPVALSGKDVATALRQLDAVRAQCRAMVTRRAVMSAGAAIVPVPGLDIGTDVAILVNLLPKVNEKFGLSEAQIATLDSESKRAAKW
jgi:hypothetical protein